MNVDRPALHDGKSVPKVSMAIIERFDGLTNYLYPMLTNTSRQHRVFRDTMIAAIFEQYRLFHAAAKSGQASRIYEADAGLAYLKELLRFSAGPDRKLVSRRQCEVASVHLAETGAMLGAWIRSVQKRSGGG
jgi:hypothetical protein